MSTPGWDDTRRSRVLLSWLAEPGHRHLWRMVRRVGPAEALRRILAGAAPDQVKSAVAARMESATDLGAVAARLEADAGRLGCRLVTPEDDEWPHQLDDLARIRADDGDPRLPPHLDPPLALWVRGRHRLSDALERSVAIVGARASTGYGDHLAAELAFGLADRGWCVVSGGAYGIDAAAHRGALGAGGITVAVLACGIDVTYPVAHGELFERIGADGLLVSEWPPGAGAKRHRFLIRNRVIAAMCRGTVVVEAAARSGARNTAKRTVELGRSLMAVPGPVTSMMSVGSHHLIRQDQARLVTSPAEVLEEVGRIGDDLAPLPHGSMVPRDELDAVSVRVLDSVPMRRAAGVERIAAESGVPAIQVRRALPLLAMLGFVEESVGGYRLTDPPAGPQPHRRGPTV